MLVARWDDLKNIGYGRWAIMAQSAAQDGESIAALPSPIYQVSLELLMVGPDEAPAPECHTNPHRRGWN